MLVMPFTGLLISDPKIVEEVEEEIRNRLGETEIRTDPCEWRFSRYYEEEMGKKLWRKFLFFRQLIDPIDLPGLKEWSNELEGRHGILVGEKFGRRINIDPGYLDHAKVVLASTKDPGHRLYLRDGIFAEVSLFYHHGSFHPFVYTYPDLRTAATIGIFNQARSIYLDLLKAVGDRKKSGSE
jgi:hypothetical protein